MAVDRLSLVASHGQLRVMLADVQRAQAKLAEGTPSVHGARSAKRAPDSDSARGGRNGNWVMGDISIGWVIHLSNIACSIPKSPIAQSSTQSPNHQSPNLQCP